MGDVLQRTRPKHVELSGDLSAAWSKLEGYAARFALVIHYADGPRTTLAWKQPIRWTERVSMPVSGYQDGSGGRPGESTRFSTKMTKTATSAG